MYNACYWFAYTGPIKPRKVDPKKFPQTCKCGSPCYRSAFFVECTNSACQHYKQPKESDYLPEEVEEKKSDFADEPTKPGS